MPEIKSVFLEWIIARYNKYDPVYFRSSKCVDCERLPVWDLWEIRDPWENELIGVTYALQCKCSDNFNEPAKYHTDFYSNRSDVVIEWNLMMWLAGKFKL